MEKYNVIIDQDKCIGCGLCVKDCVSSDIEVKDGKANTLGARCIGCGHCEAICPKNAIVIDGLEDETEEFEEQVRLDPEELLAAIKTRRTIRHFTEEEVSKDALRMIIEAGRLAPTGANSQGTSYVILSKRKDACEALAVKTFGKLLGTGSKLIPALKSMKIDENFFFKKAPIVIVIMGKDKVSASLAAQNMAFMAEAQGLGVLFSGFFTMCVNTNKRIRKIMKLEKKEKAVTTLVIGHPAVKYHRTARRKPAKVKML